MNQKKYPSQNPLNLDYSRNLNFYGFLAIQIMESYPYKTIKA